MDSKSEPLLDPYMPNEKVVLSLPIFHHDIVFVEDISQSCLGVDLIAHIINTGPPSDILLSPLLNLVSLNVTPLCMTTPLLRNKKNYIPLIQ